MNSEIKSSQHIISVENRQRLSVTAVEDVEHSDEGTIVAVTDMGVLTITGSGLHISRLDVDAGNMSVEGNISSLGYSDRRQQTKGLLRRLFR